MKIKNVMWCGGAWFVVASTLLPPILVVGVGDVGGGGALVVHHRHVASCRDVGEGGRSALHAFRLFELALCRTALHSPTMRIIGSESFLARESTLDATSACVVKLTLDDSCLQLVSSLLLVGQHVLVRLPQVPRGRHMDALFRIDRWLKNGARCDCIVRRVSQPLVAPFAIRRLGSSTSDMVRRRLNWSTRPLSRSLWFCRRSVFVRCNARFAQI